MYIAFGDRVLDSKDFKEIIESNSEFKVIKDMSKGSKREDIIAFNLSINVDILKEILKDDFEDVNSDDAVEELWSLADELGTDLEEFMPEDSYFDIRGYKLDESTNTINLIMAICHETLGERKLKDVMRRLLTQVE
ncbi:MAG: hypothetical protein Q4B63_05035 [Clostridium perfringens]|nr:hypothetical protein [Clostridium perfringens]